MDKSCHSSGVESSAINPNNIGSSTKDQYLKHLHKLSHKISKPPIRKPFEFDHQPPPPPPVMLNHVEETQPSSDYHQHHQPPVYNVSKSDFRDIVQRLTGSPAHERPRSSVQPVKQQSSRLQRNRPPPLEHVGNRPPPVGAGGVIPLNPSFQPGSDHVPGNFFTGQQRQAHQPLSPLPPLPAVHATAESPISAYMRYFQTNTTTGGNFTEPQPPQLQPQRSSTPSTSLPTPEFPELSSSIPFGCLHSPKSSHPLLSPGFPFSPANQIGFRQLTPLSPTPPAPSPRWKAL